MRVEPFSLALERPLETARGPIERREGFLVRLAVDGQPGVGEATPLPGWTEDHEECEAALERAARVAESEGPAAALDALDTADRPAARHGVALALADARARAEGAPLYRWLGGESVESVPVNATVGDGDPEATAAAAREAGEAGFDCLKLKAGARSLSADLERVAAVREACPAATLRVDANGAWTPAVAERALGQLERFGVEYVEQPLPAADVAGHAALRGTSDVGVALDESLAAAGVEGVLDAGAADVLVLKPMALGGPDRAPEAALLAREQGVRSVVTTTIDAVHARTAAVHVAASLPERPAAGLATAELLAEDLGPDPCPVESGRVTVPQGKGNVPGDAPTGSA